MKHLAAVFILASTIAAPAFSKSDSKAFLGRWDFDQLSGKGVGANWLSVAKSGATDYDIWWQPLGGHVFQVKDYKFEGGHLVLNMFAAQGNDPGMSWDLTAANGVLSGTEKHGEHTRELRGVRAPALKRKTPKAWAQPEALFNGKDLDGWEPIGDSAKSHWVVKDGLLVNEEHGANLKSTRTFDDFKLHFEVNCPDGANSGFYLRGRYEVQLEYEKEKEPAERAMGSVYGRLGPSTELPRTPGQWETFDITLVGRMVTVVRNGTTVIDQKEIAGVTGGALNADEGQPGPFYIQGDHTGGLQFRNITVAVPKK